MIKYLELINEKIRLGYQDKQREFTEEIQGKIRDEFKRNKRYHFQL